MLEMMWTKRKDFEGVVKQARQTDFTGNSMFNLTKKIHLLKNNAKGWCKNTFGNIFKQLKEVEEELVKIQVTNYRRLNLALEKKRGKLVIQAKTPSLFSQTLLASTCKKQTSQFNGF